MSVPSRPPVCFHCQEAGHMRNRCPYAHVDTAPSISEAGSDSNYKEDDMEATEQQSAEDDSTKDDEAAEQKHLEAVSATNCTLPNTLRQFR